jgi:hypothetical protein
MARHSFMAAEQGALKVTQAPPDPAGRWPANLVHDGSEEVLEAFAAFGAAGGGDKRGRGNGKRPAGFGNVGHANGDGKPCGTLYADTGTAARFFYSAKASADDRLGSKHPTVKPVSLMRWLVRLICPPGGLVLDPFAGSGTTLHAAMLEGFSAIGIEREAEYVADCHRRIAHVRGPLFADSPMPEAAPAEGSPDIVRDQVVRAAQARGASEGEIEWTYGVPPSLQRQIARDADIPSGRGEPASSPRPDHQREEHAVGHAGT